MRHKIASLIHRIWANWINYILSISIVNPDGSITIPEEKAREWLVLSKKNFDELSEKDRSNSLRNADKILAVAITNE